MPPIVTGLFTYPIKSCAALRHERLHLDEFGLAGDRRWMITDPDGMFYTQRELPRLALVQPTFTPEALRLSAPDMPDLDVPLQRTTGVDRLVRVWDHTVTAWDEGEAASAWLTGFLNTPTRLVRMAPSFRRLIDPKYAKRPAQTTFTDGYPVLLTAEESLADLNQHVLARGGDAVPMSRFRPNVVIAGDVAFAEDRWLSIYIGTVTLDVVKPCGRCKITSVDQTTGAISNAQEPLATLASYRRWDGKAVFAQNAIHRSPGLIALGDGVIILERAIDPVFQIG
jgi:hypothetical protein